MLLLVILKTQTHISAIYICSAIPVNSEFVTSTSSHLFGSIKTAVTWKRTSVFWVSVAVLHYWAQRANIHIPDRYMEEIKQKDSPLIFFFTLFFIQFEGMQVQCATKTQHQAMESSGVEEMKLLWMRRRRVLYREEQPDVLQSNFGTRFLSHSLISLPFISDWLLFVRLP